MNTNAWIAIMNLNTWFLGMIKTSCARNAKKQTLNERCRLAVLGAAGIFHLRAVHQAVHPVRAEPAALAIDRLEKARGSWLGAQGP